MGDKDGEIWSEHGEKRNTLKPLNQLIMENDYNGDDDYVDDDDDDDDA